MGANVNEDFNHIPELVETLEYLGSHHIEVGIFGDEDTGGGDDDEIGLVALARVHEFGTTITPTNAGALTVPLTPEAAGRSPGDFNEELFIPKGTNVLARETGRDDFEPLYALVQEVEIPERSFMRAGFDAHKDDIQDQGSILLNQALALEIDAETALDTLGRVITNQIQEYMTNLSEPSNSPLTIMLKDASNPLIDTGRLQGAITYKIESG